MDDVVPNIYKIALIYYCFLFIILAITCVKRNFRPIELPANCIVVLFYIVTSSFRLISPIPHFFMLKSMDMAMNMDDTCRTVDLLKYIEYVVGCNAMFCNITDCLGIHDGCKNKLRSSNSSQFMITTQYIMWAFLSSMISKEFLLIKSLCAIISCFTFSWYLIPVYFYLFQLRTHFKNPNHFTIRMPFLYVSCLFYFSLLFVINWVLGPDVFFVFTHDIDMIVNVIISMFLKSLSLIYVFYDLHIPWIECECPVNHENGNQYVISTLNLST